MLESEVFRALFTHAENAMMLVCDGKIERANHSAYKLLGYTPGQLAGKKLSRVFKTALPQPADNAVQKTFISLIHQNGQSIKVQAHTSLLAPDGDMQGLLVNIYPAETLDNVLLEEEVKKRTIALEENIARLEKTREEQNQALLQEKELNDMKSRFVTMASHEFRTPLATILSSISLVNKYTSPESEEKRTKHILRIKSAVNNMTDILNDFLNLGKLEEGKTNVDAEEFNLKNLVETITQEMQSITSGQQKIHYKYSGIETVYSDRTMIRTIIMNLVSNAVKFTGEDGVIHVEIDNTPGMVQLVIQDNGIGISAEDQKYLFDRFFRGKNATNIQGTGLGLNIVAKHVELLGGKIALESELEKGTRFMISLYPLNVTT